MRTINVLSHKGGCGKTETVLNIAYGLAEKGKRVLVIDCDPQCNTTSILLSESTLSSSDTDKFIEFYNEEKNKNANDFIAALNSLKNFVQSKPTEYDIHNILERTCTIDQAIYPTSYQNINIIPSGTELSVTDFKLKSISLDPYKALRSALNTILDQYDYVVIDNQPFKNALTFNTIASCCRENDLVIIPTKINRGGLEGTYETISTIMEWLATDHLPLDIKLLGTMVNRNAIDKKWIDALKYAFKDLMFNTTIRYQAKPIEDASMKKKILMAGPKSGVSEDYQNLVDEILQAS